MAAISLRDYVREIEKQVEGGRNEEAIAHSRHVLESFPKHVDVYRLLGKAYLESQRYGDAGDILQRVLSAVPDDFVAHVGMSMIREDEGNLDEAIWHMERAFDVQPSNSAIQDELRRLYGRRDNVEPPKIRLTRGALARMYFKGELYPQAVAELRAALNEFPDRLDLQLVLAETYAKTGQRAEAVDLAGQVLRKLPFCLAANQIMVDMLSGTEQEGEIQTYFQRLGQLDPYAAYVTAAAPSVKDVPDQAVLLNKLDYKVSQTSSGAPGQPIWASTLGVEVAEIASDQQESLPEWLASGPVTPVHEGELDESTTLPVLTGDEIQADALEAADIPGTATEEEQIPDWMKELGWTPASEPTQAAGTEIQPTGEAGDIVAEGELAPAEIPDWLKEMAPADATSEAKAEEDVSPWLDQLFSVEPPMEGTEQDAPLSFAETPSETADWKDAALVLGAAAGAAAALGRENEEPADTEAPQVPVEIPEEVIDELVLADLSAEVAPDWLVEDQEIALDESSQAPVEPAEEQLQDWLAETTPAEELRAVEISEDFPAWLEEGVELPAEPVQETAQSEIEPTDWSSEESAPEKVALVEEALVEVEAEEPPDWLVESEITPVTASFTEEAAGVEEELPGWLVESEVTPVTAVSTEEASGVEEELPGWLLEGEVAVEEQEPAEAVPEELREPPRWLFEAALEEEVETAEPVGAETDKEMEGMPDWLKAAGAVAGTAGAFEVFEWLGDEEGAEEELSLVTGIEASDAFLDQEAQPLIETEGVDLGDTQPTRVRAVAETSVTEATLTETPVIETPVVEAPVAEIPVAETPEVEAPVVEVLVAEATVAEETVAKAPVAEAPLTVALVAEALVAEAPVTEAPVVEAPVAEAPLTEAPVAEALVAEAIVAEAIVAEAPVAEAPVTEAPVAEALVAEALIPEEPAVDRELEDAFAWLDSMLTPVEENVEAIEPPVPVEEKVEVAEQPTPVADLAEVAEQPTSVEDLAEITESETADEVEPSAPPEAAAVEIPMNDDAAFAWLESLAVRQGAQEALLLKPEDRLETPPEWVHKAAEEASEPPQTGTMGIVEEKLEIEPKAGVPPEAQTPDEATSEEADFAWLEGLAVRQGAQEALLLKPEERREAPPDWLKAAIAVEATDRVLDKIDEEKEAGKTTLEQEIVETPMEREPEAMAGEVESSEPTPLAASVEQPPELPDWLSEPVAETREETLEWTPPPVARRKYDVNKITLAELERLPGIGFIMAQRVIEYRNTRGPFKKVDDLLNVPEFNAPMLDGIRENLYLVTRPEPTPATSPTPTRPRPESISPVLVPSAGLPEEIRRARRYLMDGMLDQALGIYKALIHANKDLGWVVEDLKQASSQYPGEFFVWQTLGDAYLRSDQASQAMEAFIRAEKLLVI